MKYILTICLSILFSQVWAQNAANLQPISEVLTANPNQRYTIKGLVLSGPELGGIRYIQDASGAMAIFRTSWSPEVNRGDSILVEGRLTDFFQLVQLDQINTNDYTIINSGNPLPAPIDIDLATGFGVTNAYRIVRIPNVRFLSGGPFAAQNNYTITDGTNEQQARISHQSSNMVGTPVPQEQLDIVGIMSQFSEGYQLLPRDLADLGLTGPLFASVPTASDLTTSGFTVNFTTLSPGNTRIAYGSTMSLGDTALAGDLTTSHSIDITGLSPGQLYYVRCFSVDAANDTSFAGIQVMATESNSTGTIANYFSRPADPSAASSTANRANVLEPAEIRDTIINFIASAKNTVDICIYNINNIDIINAINAAHTDGKTVRIVGNGDIISDNWNAISAASKYKRPTGGQGTGIMHHKFIVLDAEDPDPNVARVLTGSSNFTTENIIDANNIQIIQDQTLARAFTREFETLLGGEYGEGKPNRTPREMRIGGKRVQMFISPSDKVNENVIIPAIENASANVHINTMLLTRNNIAQTLAGNFARLNNNIWFVTDNNSSDNFAMNAFSILSPVLGTQARMWDGGIPQYTWRMHHKYMVVDEGLPTAYVLTGSHNWTASANNFNDENTLLFHDEDLANQFYQEVHQRIVDMQMFPATRELGNAGISNLRLYPNPTAATAQLELTAAQPTRAEIRVMNPMGQVVQHSTLQLQAQAQQHTIDLSSQRSGIYFIVVSTPEGSRSLRMVKL